MMGKKERTAAPFFWGLGSPNKQKCEDATSGRSSVFRENIFFSIAFQHSQNRIMARFIPWENRTIINYPIADNLLIRISRPQNQTEYARTPEIVI